MRYPSNLLPRNQVLGVACEWGDEGLDSSTDNDPLSPQFTIPGWLVEKPIPWSLVAYWEECLLNLVMNGQPRGLVNGYPAELKAAKKLLTHGVEMAARVCKYTANEVDGPVTLWRALDRVDEVSQLCQLHLT